MVGYSYQLSARLPILRDPLLYGIIVVGLVVSAPFFRYVGWLGDEGVLLHAAVRVVGGEVLYRDIFGILPPGGYLIVATWMKVFGVGLASVRVLAVGVIVSIAVLIYAAARLSSGSRPLAALVAVAWAASSPGTLTIINHHWLTTAASMAATVSLLLVGDGSVRRMAAFAAGLFAGTAVMITSTRGALMCSAVLLVILTAPTSRVRAVSAIAGMAVIPAGMLLYVAAHGALTEAIEDVIRYPALHYRGIQAVSFGSGALVEQLALVAIFPVAFALAAAVLALGGAAQWSKPRFRVSLVVAVVGLLGSFPRPDSAHIAFTVPLACPLCALVAASVPRSGRIAVTVLLVVLSLAGLAGTIGSAIMVNRSSVVATARGVVVPGRRIPTGEFEDLILAIDRAPSGSVFFFYPYDALLPYLTGRRHAAAIDVMFPGYTTAAQFRDTCVRVTAEAQWVVIDRQWSDPDFLQRLFPAMRYPNPPEKVEFEAVLRADFDEIVYESRGFELRKRSGRAPAARCDRI
ncbi:MAG TPA: hypothetical protein VLB12_00845 [Gemmatimonadales bacterium]|nr:hypothetical protein [Gemmatimonadales bacterium]